MILKTTIVACALTLGLGLSAVRAEEAETLASPEEVAKVTETIGKIGCTAQEVEKESDSLFELDDAECAIGQYDIKLDENFNIISMTRDE